MKVPYFAYLALVGGFSYLILFIADRGEKSRRRAAFGEHDSAFRAGGPELKAD